MVPLPTDFDYNLPQELIATSHADPRDHSRFLVVDRATGQFTHVHFYDLPHYLTPQDCLVINETKVFPARLMGKKTTGGIVEVLLLEQLSASHWRGISKPGLKVGQRVEFENHLTATVIDRIIATGEVDVEFNQSGLELLTSIDLIGQTPLPHYINGTQSEADIRRTYQTVYAQHRGSAAAPTAGLHFTPTLLDRIASQGVQIEKVTLHVGLGTFQPLRPENLATAKLHQEKYFIDADTAVRLNHAKQQGKRIIAVGTTTTRTLESNILLDPARKTLTPGWHATDLFIYPPYQFNFVNSLITNFHLPQSSLLMMITAFASQPNPGSDYTTFSNSLVHHIYTTAVAQSYRFYSFGDAMFLI